MRREAELPADKGQVEWDSEHSVGIYTQYANSDVNSLFGSKQKFLFQVLDLRQN